MLLWPWHFGALVELGPLALVLHFKRTKDRQYWAPFYFEGKVRRTTLGTIQRSRAKILWIKPATQVVPLLLILVMVGLPIWMLVSAFYWPYWLTSETVKAIGKRKRSWV